MELVTRLPVEAYKPRTMMDDRIDRLNNWLNEWNGDAVRQSEVYKSLDMDRTVFKNTLAQDQAREVKRMFDEAKEAAKEAGLKTGWLLRKKRIPPL